MRSNVVEHGVESVFGWSVPSWIRTGTYRPSIAYETAEKAVLWGDRTSFGTDPDDDRGWISRRVYTSNIVYEKRSKPYFLASPTTDPRFDIK